MQYIIAILVVVGIILIQQVLKRCHMKKRHKPSCRHAHHWHTEPVARQKLPAQPQAFISPLALLQQESVKPSEETPGKPRWQREIEEIQKTYWEAQRKENNN